MNWMHSQNSYVGTLIPNMMAFGGGVFERLLGLDEVMRTNPPC